MIGERLIPRIQKRFPASGAIFGSPPNPVVTFAPLHPAFGKIEIMDDGDELTLIAGNFTHGHFSNDDSKSTAEEKELEVDNIVEFLDRVFADRVVFWGSHQGSGGWYDRDLERDYSGPLYVWSGPLSPH